MLASSQIGISLLYFFCQADCKGIAVFSFYNILTRHLVHKNTLRLIAYYLFITQSQVWLFSNSTY